MVEKKKQLLGHIMRQVLFLHNSLIPRTEHARRVGKPRARESGHVDQFDINNIL